MTGKRPKPLVFQPATHRQMQRGINQIVDAIRPTLGPRPRTVAIQENLKASIELLDTGGVIARRIIELPDRDEDVGAMFTRQMLWQLHEKVGDGTATAAVLFQAIYNEGLRYLAAGGNAQRLRHYLEQGIGVILEALEAAVTPVDGAEQLARLAESICYDPPLAAMLGEIFDVIGQYGRLELRKGQGRELARQYVEGMYWDGGVLSREMIADWERLQTDLENAAILITDLTIEDPRQLMPAMVAALKGGFQSLLVVAGKLSDVVIGFLLRNNDPDKLRLMAVKTPGIGSDQMGALHDLAVLTGGRPFLKGAGDSLGQVQAGDLGRARRVWASLRNFGIVGGQGDPRQLREHIARLRAAHQRAEKEERARLQLRIGRLMGGSATLWIGGASEREVEARKALAERTAEALRGAIAEGIVPGGGSSLLAARPALQERLQASADADERAAWHILLQALEVPMRTIIANAGYDSSEVMAQIRLAGPGHGFDAAAEQVVDMAQAGIFDVAAVQKAVIHSAIASAALALTVDVMVHHKKRPTVYQP